MSKLSTSLLSCAACSAVVPALPAAPSAVDVCCAHLRRAAPRHAGVAHVESLLYVIGARAVKRLALRLHAEEQPAAPTCVSFCVSASWLGLQRSVENDHPEVLLTCQLQSVPQRWKDTQKV
jgi:hypothetical protein